MLFIVPMGGKLPITIQSFFGPGARVILKNGRGLAERDSRPPRDTSKLWTLCPLSERIRVVFTGATAPMPESWGSDASRPRSSEGIEMSVAASLALTLIALALFRKATASRKRAMSIAVVVFVALLLLVAFYALDALTGSGIDESVLFHLKVGLKGATVRDFTALIAITALLVVGALAAGFFAYRFVRAEDANRATRARVLAGVGVLLGAYAMNPAVLDIGELAIKYGTRSIGAGTRVPAPAEYVPVDARDFSGAEKNLVLFYLESLERTYLDEKVFPGLAPNLRALEQQALSFTDITQLAWTSWTIGAMVATQCGVPVAGSSAGSDAFLPAATCIGDLLNDAGYDLSYLHGASLEFAGSGAFYETHGFASVEGARELLGQLDDPGYESIWGIYDDSLLDLAAHRFDTLAAGEEPFGMVLLTVDTHHPRGGIVSATCEDIIYRDGSNAFLNAVHCADHMAGRFIRHVLDSSAMKDTVLVVLSDHLARPNAVWDTLEAAERRNLMFAFSSGIEPGTIDKSGMTFDVAPTILGLLGAETEAMGYGRDLLGPAPSLRSEVADLDRLLEEHWPFLASLAAFPQLDFGLRVEAATERAFLGARFVRLPAVFQVDEDLRVVDVLYDMDDGITLPVKLADLWYGNRFIWVDGCERIAVFEGRETPLPAAYCALAGSLGSPGLASFALPDGKPLSLETLENVFAVVAPDEAYFASVAGTFRENAMLVDAEEVRSVTPTGLAGDFVIRSSGGADAWESWVINRAQGDKVYLERGLSLLGLNQGSAPVKLAHKDTCGWGGEVHDPDAESDLDFGTVIERSAARYGAFAVVAHSSPVCYKIDPHLDALFSGTPFRDWTSLWYEQPYVAILAGNGHVEEFIGERNAAIALELRDFVAQAPQEDRPVVLRAEPLEEQSKAVLPPVFADNLCRFGGLCGP
ncbi:MAG TPA: hypothetical protein DIU07_21655 [Rhodobacteraceae bacterium]|nr:hypothetical protein [Paracoccaceae bacterium]